MQIGRIEVYGALVVGTENRCTVGAKDVQDAECLCSEQRGSPATGTSQQSRDELAATPGRLFDVEDMRAERRRRSVHRGTILQSFATHGGTLKIILLFFIVRDIILTCPYARFKNIAFGNFRMKFPKLEKLSAINCTKVLEEEFRTNACHWTLWDITLWLVKNKIKG